MTLAELQQRLQETSSLYVIMVRLWLVLKQLKLRLKESLHAQEQATPENRQRRQAWWETLLGSEHLDVAQSLENLATVYESQGNYRAPQPLLQQALAIRLKNLGGSHPRVGELTRRIARIRTASERAAEGA